MVSPFEAYRVENKLQRLAEESEAKIKAMSHPVEDVVIELPAECSYKPYTNKRQWIHRDSNKKVQLEQRYNALQEKIMDLKRQQQDIQNMLCVPRYDFSD